jgi:hypothetical protein
MLYRGKEGEKPPWFFSRWPGVIDVRQPFFFFDFVSQSSADELTMRYHLEYKKRKEYEKGPWND